MKITRIRNKNQNTSTPPDGRRSKTGSTPTRGNGKESQMIGSHNLMDKTNINSGRTDKIKQKFFFKGIKGTGTKLITETKHFKI